MSIRNTSKAAFLALIESCGVSKQRRGCLEYIHDNSGCTRNEIERGTGYRQASVSGRVNDLMKIGAVVEDGCKKDSISKMSNNKLYCSCCVDSAGFAA